MKATGFLLIIVAIWVIINAGNIADVMQGKASFNFIKPASKTKPGTNPKATASSADKPTTDSSPFPTFSFPSSTGAGGSGSF